MLKTLMTTENLVSIAVIDAKKLVNYNERWATEI